MKLLVALLLLGATALFSAGQSPSNSEESPITVLKFSWSKERIGWEMDPFSGPIEDFDDVRARVRNEKRVDDAKKSGNSAVADKVSREARADQANMAQKHKNTPSRYVFVYKMTVQNTTAKQVKSIDWDYIFASSKTGEIARLEFTNDVKIAPGKSKELSVTASKAPARTVSVHALDKNERQGLDGQVVVVRIQYADGSVWQLPRSQPGGIQ